MQHHLINKSELFKIALADFSVNSTLYFGSLETTQDFQVFQVYVWFMDGCYILVI